jgi:hypothetical protein
MQGLCEGQIGGTGMSFEAELVAQLELPQLVELGCCIVCHKPVEIYNSEYYLLDGGEVAHVVEPCGSKAVALRPRVPIRVRDDSQYSVIEIGYRAPRGADTWSRARQLQAQQRQAQKACARKPKLRR